MTHIALPRMLAVATRWAGLGKALTRPGTARGESAEMTPPLASRSAVHPPSFAATVLLRVSELHDMLVAAVVPSTKVVADLFPLTHQRPKVGHSSRIKKIRACPSPLTLRLRCARA